MANTLPRWMTGKVWEEPDAVKPPKAPNAWQNAMGVFGQANQQAGAQAAQSQRLNDQMTLQQQQQAGAMANQATVGTDVKANIFNMLQSVYAQNKPAAPTTAGTGSVTVQPQPEPTGTQPNWRPEPGKIFGQLPQPIDRQSMELWWDVVRRGIDQLKQKYPQYAQYLSAAMPNLPENWNPGQGTMVYWFAPLEFEAAIESGNINLIKDYGRKLNQFYQSGFTPGAGDIQRPPSPGDDVSPPPGDLPPDIPWGTGQQWDWPQGWQYDPMDGSLISGRANYDPTQLPQKNWQYDPTTGRQLAAKDKGGGIGDVTAGKDKTTRRPIDYGNPNDPKTWTGGTSNSWQDITDFFSWWNSSEDDVWGSFLPPNITAEQQTAIINYIKQRGYAGLPPVSSLMYLTDETIGAWANIIAEAWGVVTGIILPDKPTGGDGGDGGAAARKLEQQLQSLIQQWQNTTTSGQLRGGAAPTTWYY